MHHADVDSPQARPARGQVYHPEVCGRLPVESCAKLGQRTWFVLRRVMIRLTSAVKWLGKDAVNPFAVDGKASKEELIQQLRQWCIATGRAVVRPVLIVSYETLRLYVDELKNAPIGLLLCDEGHRLKNGESQTFVALNSLNVQRRII